MNEVVDRGKFGVSAPQRAKDGKGLGRGFEGFAPPPARLPPRGAKVNMLNDQLAYGLQLIEEARAEVAELRSRINAVNQENVQLKVRLDEVIAVGQNRIRELEFDRAALAGRGR